MAYDRRRLGKVMGKNSKKRQAFRIFLQLLRAKRFNLRYSEMAVQSLIHGLEEYQCPICGHVGGLGAYGHFPIFNSRCIQCNSVQRHRLLYLVHSRIGLFHPDDTVLHFAPEPAVTQFVAPYVKSYATADIAMEGVNHIVDIEKLPFESGSYSVVLCSHVLEHVDDIKALAEIRRVLTADGRAILMVPIAEGCEKTYENSEISSPQDRTKYFGQDDHVRLYGRDFRDRVKSVGFDITEYTAFGEDVGRYGLIAGEKVFLCRRTSA